MEKGDSCASRAASHARMSGDLQKNAVRPGQAEGKPGRRNRQRSKRHAQPDQFVVEVAWSETPRLNLHPCLINAGTRSTLRAPRTSVEAKIRRRSKRSMEGERRLRPGRYRFHAREQSRCYRE